MKLESLTLSTLKIPFKVTFAHASATRSEGYSVWVEANAGGKTGYGESCPRSYVTGEDFETTQLFFNQHRESWLAEITDLSSLQKWIATHQHEIDQAPAAWAAVELAILDLLARLNNQTIEELLDLPMLKGEYQYSALLGDSAIEKFSGQFKQYRKLGFTDFKIKLSGDMDKDKEKINILKNINNPIRVRADANNLWQDARTAIHYVSELDYPFGALEEPLLMNQYEQLAIINKELQTRIILDESFLRKQQFSQLKSNADSWIINLRVSKMGGLLRSLSIIEQAREMGIAIIIGAHVGETSLLTRAALTVANASQDVLLAQEGAFGSHLLVQDICDEPIMFGHAGILKVDAFACMKMPGFGIEPVNKNSTADCHLV